MPRRITDFSHPNKEPAATPLPVGLTVSTVFLHFGKAPSAHEIRCKSIVSFCADIGVLKACSSTIDSSFAVEDSFAYKPIPASKSQPGPSSMVQPPAVRPLSSADEMGPVPKKPRSTTRQRAPPSSTAADTNMQTSKSAGALLQGVADDRSKSSKARARPALTIANIFSSPGRRAQQAATSSRSTAPSKAAKEQPPITRRSSRLLGGSTSKTKLAPKVILRY